MNVALPSTTIRLDIAFTKVSTVEIVNAKPNSITNRDNNSLLDSDMTMDGSGFGTMLRERKDGSPLIKNP